MRSLTQILLDGLKTMFVRQTRREAHVDRVAATAASQREEAQSAIIDLLDQMNKKKQNGGKHARNHR